MKTWLDLSTDERLAILANITEKTGIIEAAVEKDWWVSMALKALFQTSCSDNLVFKGGTSLSKGWNIIERFSEDIDLAIDRTFFGFDGELGRNQLNKLRKSALMFAQKNLLPELNSKLQEMGVRDYEIYVQTPHSSDEDPAVIIVPYKSILGKETGYIKYQIKIKISCRSLREPFEAIPLKSLIAFNYPEEEFSEKPFLVNTVVPTRTFLEKAFLLHELFQKESHKAMRMSRHLYDLEKLMDTEFGISALSDSQLYKDIVCHRFKFNKQSGLDYTTCLPSLIDFCPPEDKIAEWENDYKDMQESFIYGKSLPFNELIVRIKILRERFRGVKIDDLGISAE